MTSETAAANANYGATASGSSFYAAMRILPRAQREAMFQIYNFCRQVDDIADSHEPRPERLAGLQQWRDDIDALYQGRPPARLRDYVAAVRTETLLGEGKPLSAEIRDFRLGLEVAVIQAFAEKIVGMLKVRDPLSERVHLGKSELLAQSIGAITAEMIRRAAGRHPLVKPVAGA